MKKIIEKYSYEISSKIIYFNFDDIDDLDIVNKLYEICVNVPPFKEAPHMGPSTFDITKSVMEYLIENNIHNIIVNSQPGYTSFYKI